MPRTAIIASGSGMIYINGLREQEREKKLNTSKTDKNFFIIGSILNGLNRRLRGWKIRRSSDAYLFAGAKGAALQPGLQNDKRMKCGQGPDKIRTIVSVCKSNT
ncbi:hypothetical protein LWM68_46790 [Niabella sp. W65]|nr:hypothetical protein [Niabella sp. W65]MCH7369579.1 hypothetical protein [Niabella sp. W65]ULT45125.1 hypothetical protein KRR40_18590 [Niabella sp. I65]